MNLGDRLQEMRKALGISQGSMAYDLDITQTSLSRYETGRVNPPWDFVAKISDVYNISGTWLLSGKGDMLLPCNGQGAPATSHVIDAKGLEVEDSGRDLVEIPIMGIIAAGPPVTNHDIEPLGSVQIALPDPQNYNALRVYGDSMMPQIEPDDVVLIRRETDWRVCEGRTCAVMIDYEVTLKRVLLERSKQQLVLMPFNRIYDPIIVDPESQDLRIMGILAYLIRKF